MKLEYDKRYVRADGAVTGPLIPSSDTLYKFMDPLHRQRYLESGEWVQGGITPKDLTAEYENPDVRRYDLAKDCLLALIGASRGGFLAPLEASHLAVTYADLLIEKLEETK